MLMKRKGKYAERTIEDDQSKMGLMRWREGALRVWQVRPAE